jgi:large subunit ribosomal protein L25
MPTQIELSAEPRTVFGKHVRRLRREGIVPANIYGHGASRAIQAPSRALERLLSEGGRTGVVAISFDGQSQTALFKALQRDPRSGLLLHIDFQAVSMEEQVSSVVPIRFIGESSAVTRLGGAMMHPRTELHVSARAVDLPDVIEVDVSAIRELHGAIHVSDLPSTDAYVVTEPGEEVLATVVPPTREEEEAAEEAPAEGAAAEAAEAEGAEEQSSEAESAQ